MKEDFIERRRFLKGAAAGAVSLLAGWHLTGCSDAHRIESKEPRRKPNLVFLLADQWRAQAAGYAGNPDVITPHLDGLARESVNFTNAVSGCPVCCPYRASLITGRYPLTHGVFLNDVRLNNDAVSIAQAYNNAGYDTAYIGKWHLDGDQRSAYIPRERRQGFKFWKALGCTHDYNNSYYYADKCVTLKWGGYDAIAQTDEARRYIQEHAGGRPFVLFLSWGPPHSPYHTAPQRYKDLFKDKNLTHIAALDDCIGTILKTLKETGLEDDTIVVFTSDHGDMLYSQGERKKQRPWDESIRVPFLVCYPAVLGKAGRTIDMPINTPDIMPTLLALSGVDIPDTVEGADFSAVLRGTEQPKDNAALITCPSPFGQWKRKKHARPQRPLAAL
jgi:arylsulfatase A-like enzyme